MKRATLSISNNIAKGFEYENNLQFMQFIRYSKESAGEVRSMIHALYKIKHIDEANHKNFLKYLSSHKPIK